MNYIKILNIVTTILIIAFLTSCSDDPPVTSDDPSLSEKLQKALDDGINKYGGKGFSAAVIMPDGFHWNGASGMSHGSTPITTDMLFSAGSITKTFTAAAIMKFAEGGEVKFRRFVAQMGPFI